MAAAPESLLMTVEQYRELPPREDVVQELHWGQVVTLTRPKMGHTKLQYRLLELLGPLAQAKGIVTAEIPFRALPEYELRGADIAFVSHARWVSTDEDDNLEGSPELVIEILSPSNTGLEMKEKASLCLSTEAEEFWIVDPKRKRITVTRRQGGTFAYEMGDRIPLPLFDGELPVDQIFKAL